MHIIFTIANNSSVPYFNWFAEKAATQTEHKFSFLALCKVKPKMIEDVGSYGWECYWIPFDDQKRKIGMLSAFYKTYLLLKKLKPDVVHTHLFDDSLPVLFAARIANVKIRAIVKADTGFHFNYKPKWILADKFNNWNATTIIPPSKEAEKFVLKNEKADPNKVVMIHHGIPSKIFTKQLNSYKREIIEKYSLEGKIVVGTVSRLIAWKGYEYIIEAAKKAVLEYPNLVFLFVGEGPQDKELKQLVKDADLNNHVFFLGWMDRAYIPSFYGVLDVYVHAANFEPFGFVIPEAMMNEVPIVSTPTGSALDSLIHKENGYLAKYKDSDSLAEGILYSIKHGNEYRAKGKKTALKMYEFKVMYNNYIKLYEAESL
jgi:glycosyltransferase involved in cell wall biosynthesis